MRQWHPPFIQVFGKQTLYSAAVLTGLLAVTGLAFAAPFVGVEDIQLSQSADKHLRLTFETDFPLTYSLAVPGMNRMEITLHDAQLAEHLRRNLAQRGRMVGLQNITWRDGAPSGGATLVLEGPKLATRRLVIEGATPGTIKATQSATSPPPEPTTTTYQAESIRPVTALGVSNPVSVPAPPTVQTAGYSASELMGQATEAYNAGNTNAALQLAKAATEKASANPTVWGSYGELLLENKQYTDAVSAFRKALAQTGGNTTQQQVFLDRLAVAMRKITPPANAAMDLSNVLRLYPQAANDLVLAHWMLGELYFDAGNFDAAERTLAVAAVKEPGNADLQARLGLTYEMQGDTALATKAFRQAVQHQPNHSTARPGLARLSPNDPLLTAQATDAPQVNSSKHSPQASSNKPSGYARLTHRRILRSVGGGFRPNY